MFPRLYCWCDVNDLAAWRLIDVNTFPDCFLQRIRLRSTSEGGGDDGACVVGVACFSVVLVTAGSHWS